jgi:anti-anti-sigma regulatory factor
VTPMRITTDVNTSGVAILAVAGRLCADTADGLTAAVAAAVHGHRLTRLVVDLARVGDADENAINALLQGRATALQAGVTFRVIRPQTPVRQVLHRTDTCQLLTWESSSGPTPRRASAS